MRADVLERLNAERAARRATILVTDITEGTQRLVCEAEIPADPLAEILARHLAAERAASSRSKTNRNS